VDIPFFDSLALIYPPASFFFFFFLAFKAQACGIFQYFFFLLARSVVLLGYGRFWSFIGLEIGFIGLACPW